jgi:hypothetical protein
MPFRIVQIVIGDGPEGETILERAPLPLLYQTEEDALSELDHIIGEIMPDPERRGFDSQRKAYRVRIASGQRFRFIVEPTGPESGKS